MMMVVMMMTMIMMPSGRSGITFDRVNLVATFE